MDSAIAPHLQCPRSNPARTPENHVPAYPGWSARLDKTVGRVVFANFGIQWLAPEDEVPALGYVRDIVKKMAHPSGADQFDIARYKDEAGFDNLVVLSYWLDPSKYKAWRDEVELSLQIEATHLGRFEEVLTPLVDRVETLYSAPEALAGLGKTTKELSGEIIEHAYWGSARDRLPISQTDALTPSGKIEFQKIGSDGNVIRVGGHENVAVIRSGQNWSDTSGEERNLYLQNIEPTLQAGMNYLRDNGAPIGCYFNRYMRLVDLDGRIEEKSFGWSYWHSLSEMEEWAESHKTHLDIFNAFNDVVVQLNFNLDLKLSHEIYVVGADEQAYTYYNCHSQTGFLKLTCAK